MTRYVVALLVLIAIGLSIYLGIVEVLIWAWPVTLLVSWSLVSTKTGKTPAFWMARALMALEAAQWATMASFGPWLRLWWREFQIHLQMQQEEKIVFDGKGSVTA